MQHFATPVQLQALGDLIRQRRRELRLNQTQLAQSLGWSQERVSVLENGKYGMPSVPALAALAAALDLPLSRVLKTLGYPMEQETAAQSVLEGGTSRSAAGNVAARLQFIHTEGRRIQVGVEDLQARVQLLEQQMTRVDSLRADLRLQRRTMDDVCGSLRRAVSSSMDQQQRQSGALPPSAVGA